MKVLHISTECYPAAKAGGMGDVVGALPIYLPKHNVEASVILPRYKRKWFEDQTFETVHNGGVQLGVHHFSYEIHKLKGSDLKYPLFCINLPGLFDREDIYLGMDGHGYHDEDKRNIAFQRATLDWIVNSDAHFDVLHCHDHMTGLIPFMIKCCPDFDVLKNIPTLFSIHNGQYRGIFDWSVNNYLPYYDARHGGLLDWDGNINSLAAAIKCAWKVNTVSPSYMRELIDDFDTLTGLVRSEEGKCTGIINGIDNDLWDPSKDEFLDHHLEKSNWKSFKSKNKSALLKKYNLKARRPLIGFIGRMAHQKGADILIQSIEQCLQEKLPVSAVILGSGDKELERSLQRLEADYPRDIKVIIAYDEKLAREIYAASDFLMMPSRFEPCGLNQMYSMRYGTIPIVSHVGGLKDTVPDVKRKGHGIVSPSIDAGGFFESLKRAITLYKDKKRFGSVLSRIIKVDFSWDQSASKYAEIYKELTNIK